MIPIQKDAIQKQLDAFANEPLYIHLELTMGAYAAHFDSSKHPAANFIRNAVIQYSQGSIEGHGPYRVGLKLEHGWVYAEGLTHAVEDERSEEHTSELQSRENLVCRLLLEKKKNKQPTQLTGNVHR